MITTSDTIIKTRRPKPRHPILKELADRFSPRHFSSYPIPQKDMYTIFEAARFAPSGYNAQPWYFYWCKNGSPAFKKILTSLPNFNSWAKTASVLIMACYLEKGDKGTNEFAVYDLGASVLALVLQAQSLGYYARQMGIFDAAIVKDAVSIEKNQKQYVIIAMGKLGDYSKASEDIIRRDLETKPRKVDIVRKI